jgi:hypothetical protein
LVLFGKVTVPAHLPEMPIRKELTLLIAASGFISDSFPFSCKQQFAAASAG